MKITPSILNADLANLAAEVARIPDADGIHVDVMDNHFVPNLTIGLPVVESLMRHTSLPLDVHLMIEDPDRWAVAYAELGVEYVTYHIEAASAPIRLAREIRKAGAKPAVAISPATEVSRVMWLLEEVDMVLVMSVEPGFGGQSFLHQAVPKIATLRAAIDSSELDIDIQVDGGISPDTIEVCRTAGANVFVAGSAVYGADDPNEMVKRLKALG